MKNRLLPMALAGTLGIFASTVHGALAAPSAVQMAPMLSSASDATAGWICDRSDNICGLDDPKMLSKPAKVDYDALLKATPEYKKIREDKIDPNSSEGINLRQKAVDRVRDRCDVYRQQNGYCSVWKTIRHTDGRAVPDVTEQVKALL